MDGGWGRQRGGEAARLFYFIFFLVCFWFWVCAPSQPQGLETLFPSPRGGEGGSETVVWFTGGGYGGDEKRMEPRSRTENENRE